MGHAFSDLVTDGPLLVAAAVAALVGLISFASPCVLPLVPGYLSYVAGLVGTVAPAEAIGSRSGGTATAVRIEVSPRARMVLGAVLFVLGFSVVFVAFATAFGGLGRLVLQYSRAVGDEAGEGLPHAQLPSASTRSSTRRRSFCDTSPVYTAATRPWRSSTMVEGIRSAG